MDDDAADCTLRLADGGQVRVLHRGRYVHVEVTDANGKMSLCRATDEEARKLVRPLRVGAYRAELARQGVTHPVLPKTVEPVD